MSPRWQITVVLVAALLGFGFAAASTYDFAAHLDRQVHNLHCSFIPGLSSSSPSGAEGCQLTLMSPYSSMFRKTLWGGIPVALPAMSVFIAIAALAALILLLHAELERNAVFSLLLLSSIPVAASLVMGSIAAFKLHAACKQCIGMYTSSALVGIFAFLAQRGRDRIARFARSADPFDRSWLLPLPLAALLVLIPMTSYVLAMPQYGKFTKGCGTLPQPEDRHGVLVHLKAEQPGAHKVLEIFDPLCPACKAFEERLQTSRLDKQIQRDLLLFPLDNTCNWMVDNAMHPGSCAVSAAVLCAGERAKDVVDWAFAEQTRIHAATASDATAAARLVEARFPELKSCMTSSVTKARLAQSLRWAVRNQVPVLTPQFYVDGNRLCDEDTDLGMEYTLSRMLKGNP
jgi:uncharacterized membrane protein/protein-disulfide isomerase